MIADYKEREKQRNAELDAAAEATRLEKQAAAATKAAEEAAAATAARVATQSAGGPENAAAATAKPGATEGVAVKQEGARRSSPVWAAFSTVGCEPGKACCQLLKEGVGGPCAEVIVCKHGPSGTWSHLMYHHKADYIRLKPPTDELDLTLNAQTKMSALLPAHRDAIHKAIAR
eukprot:5219820-Prymnesium_polylepis.1